MHRVQRQGNLEARKHPDATLRALQQQWWVCVGILRKSRRVAAAQRCQRETEYGEIYHNFSAMQARSLACACVLSLST